VGNYHGNRNITARIIKTFDDKKELPIKELPIFDRPQEALFKKVTFSTGSLA
jgi:hypothetical protein